MAPIRYRLHYEDYSEHLMSRFGKLLQMQSLVDMTLMCSSHTLRVHKAVLAASSAYFQEVLQKQTGEPLIILKMRFNVLKCLVEFMYCGKTQCLEENLDELVSAAQFLKIKGLSKVTKEGLGITNNSELPVFTPPVVINRPPQSLLDLHTQDIGESKSFSQMSTAVSTQPLDSVVRNNKDMVVRIPFDIEGGPSTSVNYSDPSRNNRPRRGRPSFKRMNSWEGVSAYGRATDKNLMRREQDPRKSLYPPKHMQTKHIQDYMDRVTLSQAVNSICNTDSSSHSYLNMDNDLIYMDQNVSSNSLNSADPFAKDSLGNDTITNYTNTLNDGLCENSNKEMNTAMSQYVNALKNAGLPTDLPILFESGDGSYINVNEQVLLDMVQSSEIQYEVIEQPNIIEKVADPSEIKSIDELSKSIERGEMLIGSKTFPTNEDYDKDKRIREDTIKSLNEILPDNLDTFEETQNYVVIDRSLQPGNATDRNTSNEFSCIDNDMQFFTKSMSDDVKKYYDDQHLNDSRVLEEYCPASTSFDSSFSMSLLDTKANLGENTSKQYNSMNNDEQRGSSCYDFTLQLPESNAFKEDPLDCLLSTPKLKQNRENYVNRERESRIQEEDEIMKDLMNIEDKIMENCDDGLPNEVNQDSEDINVEALIETKSNTESFKVTTSPNNTEWDFAKVNEINRNEPTSNSEFIDPEPDLSKSVVDLTDSMNLDTEKWDSINKESLINKKDEDYNYKNTNNLTLDDNIPFAVGLLPLHKADTVEKEGLSKRKNNISNLSDEDEKTFLRKSKCKKI